MKKLFLFILFIFAVFHIQAQYFVSGQDRGNIKWLQIETDNFRIVYPDYADSIAQHYANSLRWAYENVTKDMHHQPKKIDVLIHTEASNSNGMVAWAPKRMEIFSTFPEDIYPQDWFEQLALHEYRHVIQIDKLNQGLTKILSYIFGEQAVGGVLGLYIPLWFLEGDAVWAETEYGLSGRGRLNYFSEELKLQVIHNRIYSFDKATMGSFKDFVPNHYVLGYNLVNEVRKDFGDSVWGNVIDYVGRNPYMIVPFSHALKMQTGMPKKKLYDYEMKKLDSLWRISALTHADSIQEYLYSPDNKAYTNFHYPSYINDSTLFSYKTGMDDIGRFVSINLKTGEEKLLYTPGNSNFYSCSFSDSMVCWSELRYDARWSHRRYHVLMTFDLRTGKAKQLTNKSQLFAPELNADATKVVCVELTFDNKFYINVLDAKTGEMQEHFPSHYFPIKPVFGTDDSKIYFIRLHPHSGQSIAALDLTSNEIYDLTKPDFFVKASLVNTENEIFFESEYNGVFNVFALDIKEKNIVQITDAPFSISDLNIDDKGNLYYSYLTSKGLQIALYAKDRFIRKPYISSSKYNEHIFESELPRLNATIQSKTLIEKKFDSKKYFKLAHLVNVHSWAPINININTYEFNPGVSIMSQNLLGTAEIIGGYKYLTSNKGNMFNLDFSYKGWYPIVGMGVEYYNYLYHPFVNSDSSVRAAYNFLYLTVAQPLNLSKGKYYSFIQPSVSFGFQSTTLAQGKYYKALRYRFYAHHLLKMSHRDLEPRWGQRLDANFYHTPYSDFDFGYLAAVETDLYFPGIGRHHSIKIYAAAQKNVSSEYSYANVIDFPRGYYDVQSEAAYSLKMDYKFPIFYPDFSITSLAYITRLRAGLFYDMADNIGINAAPMNSFGLDLTCDLHFLRFIAPIELGFRTTYVPDLQEVGYDLLFSINFNDI